MNNVHFMQLPFIIEYPYASPFSCDCFLVLPLLLGVADPLPLPAVDPLPLPVIAHVSPPAPHDCILVVPPEVPGVAASPPGPGAGGCCGFFFFSSS